MRKLLLLIVMLVVSSCTTNSHTINHCGIDIPICEHEVQGARTLPDEIEFQEKQMKQKMLRSMNLLLDQVIQNILSGM